MEVATELFHCLEEGNGWEDTESFNGPSKGCKHFCTPDATFDTQGPDSIALIFFSPFFRPLFGSFFDPFFEIAYCYSTECKEFMHMFLANGLSVPF